MNGRLLNSSGDIFIEEGASSVRRSKDLKERTTALILTTLRTFQGECFTNYEAGVPWFDEILGESVLFMDEIGEEIKDKIRSVPGVSDVLDVSVKIDGRNVSGTFKVKLDDGSSVASEF